MAEEKKNSITISGMGDVSTPPMWNMHQNGVRIVGAIKSRNDSAGVMRYCSSLPLKCGGRESCVYGESCYLSQMGISEDDLIGQVCPIEVELILNYFNNYVQEFDIEDLDNPKNTTVIGLIKDLIDTELQIERANKRIMIDGDYLEDRVIAVTDSGQKITNKEVNQHILFKSRMQEQKNKILDLLHATPKNKAKEQNNRIFDPSTYAKELMRRAAELGYSKDEIIEGTISPVIEDDEDGDD